MPGRTFPDLNGVPQHRIVYLPLTISKKYYIDTSALSLYIHTVQAASARELKFGSRSERNVRVQQQEADPV
jgi:hypothetical protein